MTCISPNNLVDPIFNELLNRTIPVLNLNYDKNNRLYLHRNDLEQKFENILIVCDTNNITEYSDPITLVLGVSFNNNILKNKYEQNLSSLPNVNWISGDISTQILLNRNNIYIQEAYKDINQSHIDLFFVKLIPARRIIQIGAIKNNSTTIYKTITNINLLNNKLYATLYDIGNNTTELAVKYGSIETQQQIPNSESSGYFGHLGYLGTNNNFLAGTRSLNNKFEFCQPDLSEYTIRFFYDVLQSKETMLAYFDELIDKTNIIFKKYFNIVFRIIGVDKYTFTNNNIMTQLYSLNNGADFTYAFTSFSNFCCSSCSSSIIGCGAYPWSSAPYCRGVGWIKDYVSFPVNEEAIKTMAHELGHNFGAKHTAGLMSASFYKEGQGFIPQSIEEMVSGINNFCGSKKETIAGTEPYTYDSYNLDPLSSVEVKLPTRIHLTKQLLNEDTLIKIVPQIIYKNASGKPLNPDRFSVISQYVSNNSLPENTIGLKWESNTPWPAPSVGPILSNPNLSWNTILLRPSASPVNFDLIIRNGTPIVKYRVTIFFDNKTVTSNECEVIVLDPTFYIDIDPGLNQGEQIFRFTTKYITNQNLTYSQVRDKNPGTFYNFQISLLDLDGTTEIPMSTSQIPDDNSNTTFLLGRLYKIKTWNLSNTRPFRVILDSNFSYPNKIVDRLLEVEEEEVPIYDIDTSFSLNIISKKTTFFMDKKITVPINLLSNIEKIYKIYTTINDRLYIYQKNYEFSNLSVLRPGFEYSIEKNVDEPVDLQFSII